MKIAIKPVNIIIKTILILFCIWALITVIIPNFCYMTGIVKTADGEAEKLNAELIEALNTGDTEKIKGLFCDDILGNGANDDIDEQIEHMFDFFDKSIFPINKKDIKRSNGGSEERSSSGGEKVYWEFSPNMDIFTSNGKYYEIKMDYCAISKADPSKVGVSKILVKNLTGIQYYPLGDSEEWQRYREASEDEDRRCTVGRKADKPSFVDTL